MTGDRDEKGAGEPRQAKGKKNAAALSAALRANLQRRKARERALRETAAARHESESEKASASGSDVVPQQPREGEGG